MTLNNLYEKALFIRRFEEALLTLFKEGLVSGTVHTCVGQEGPLFCLHQFLNNSIDAFFCDTQRPRALHCQWKPTGGIIG